jgi:hypothetical protein
MGFYSVTPGYSYYVIGTPTFKSAAIHLENGKSFTIRANNLSKENIYIQSATLDGTKYDYTTISHEAIMHGGELAFEMGGQPSDWGKNSGPPLKPSDNLLVPTPYFTSAVNTFKDSLYVGVQSLCAECTIVAGYANDSTMTLKNRKVAFILKKDTKIWAYAQHPDGRTSETITTQFYKLDDKLKLTLRSEYANQYSAGGNDALIDRQYGTANFRTGSWQGYEGQDFEATLDLGELKEEVEISIGFLQDIKSWIWYPTKVEAWVYYGDDVVEIYEENLDQKLQKKEGAMRKTVSLKIKKPSKKIKIVAKSIGPCPEWHLGAGGDSWLFLDEITVK